MDAKNGVLENRAFRRSRLFGGAFDFPANLNAAPCNEERRKKARRDDDDAFTLRIERGTEWGQVYAVLDPSV